MSYAFQALKRAVLGGPLEAFLRKAYVRSTPILWRDRLSREFVFPYSDLELKYGVIFVHIPKNAGNGVAHSLFGMPTKGHNFLCHYKRADPDRYERSFKFAFSRNVWSRFYSAYSYLNAGGFGVYDGEFADKYVRGFRSFNEFVLRMGEDENFSKKVMSWTHFIPQYKFILVDGVNELDYLGCVEDMQESLDYIRNILRLPPMENKVVNRSSSDDYRKFYNSKSVDIVGWLYRRDCDILKCGFE